MIYQGDDILLDVIVTDEAGAGMDLTGYTPKAQIRLTPPDATVLAEFVCTVEANVIHLVLAHTDSAAITTACAWDVQITSAGGAVRTLAYGAVKPTLEVTR